MKRSLMTFGLIAGFTGLVLTGCSGDAPKTVAAKAPAPSSSTTKPAFVENTANTPGTLKDFVGARADVSDTTCKTATKGWTASGAVKNPTDQAAQYRIYVSFLDGDTTTGIAQTDLAKVGANKTAQWTATVGAAGTNLRCILRVERAVA